MLYAQSARVTWCFTPSQPLRLNQGKERTRTRNIIIPKDSRVRSIWTYLTASPCYTTERERERGREVDYRERERERETDRDRDRQTDRQRDRDREIHEAPSLSRPVPIRSLRTPKADPRQTAALPNEPPERSQIGPHPPTAHYPPPPTHTHTPPLPDCLPLPAGKEL